jgi:hypothetical protein
MFKGFFLIFLLLFLDTEDVFGCHRATADLRGCEDEGRSKRE